ncbi:methyl-accepting chemotaxis protein [Fontibacillus solani]|uniref:Methyl-accepting chemotaxis protein n=1 Tax=Fontibacillus solani TaxID=1572857 RepID=A0A7W3SP55_9BACL|nr:methyl-accepting chemotaxis protein [Fontibacillus solani]MBA9083653.1 methyl-accepting chemotaxis protein [Fontibacillus solani]
MKNKEPGVRLFGAINRSVGVKLFLIIISSIVVLVSILGMTSYTVSKNIIKKKVASSSLQTIEQASDKLDFLFGVYESQSRQLLVDQELMGQLVAYNGPELATAEKTRISNSIVERLNSMVAADKRLYSVRLVPKSMDKTKLVSSKGASSLNLTENSNLWLDKVIEANGEIVYIPAQKKGLFDLNSEPTMMIGRLLKNLNNPEKEYIVLLEVRDQELSGVLANISLAESSQIMLISSDNDIVHIEDSNLLGSKSTIHISDNGEESKGSLFVKDEHGKDQLVVYKQNELSKWNVVGVAPVSELVKETSSIIQITIIIIVLSALLSVAIGMFVIRMVGRPLQKLSSLMEEGEKGNLSVRTDFRGQDEIGKLGQSFNQMMEQISVLVNKTNDSAQHVLHTAFELSEVSQKSSTMAREVSVAIEEIAQGAMELSIEAEKEMTYAENIGLNMDNVIDSNSKMEESADRVYQISSQGTEYMNELILKTNSTEELTSSMIGKVDRLKESTISIHKILEVLKAMTQQTNILSLNASIEAVRAGAAGKGFMVIADEIRNLSDQSKDSISIVQTITSDIQREVEETVELLLTASPLLTEQIHSVKEAATIFDHVREEMDLFIQHNEVSTTSIKELNQSQLVLSESISNVSAVAEQSSASSEEVASIASEQLNSSEKLVILSDKLADLSESLKESLILFQTSKGE